MNLILSNGSLPLLKILSQLDVIYLYLGFSILAISVGYLAHLKFASARMFSTLSLYLILLTSILLLTNPNSILSTHSKSFVYLFFFFSTLFLLVLSSNIKYGLTINVGFVMLILLAITGMFSIFLSEDLFF